MALATPGRRRALILDRDGVINHDLGYVHRVEDCRFIDGIFAMAKAFADRGFAIVIATNQAGIGRGLYGEAEYAALRDFIAAEFGRRGIAIAAAYHCPDHPTEGVGVYRRENPWRKPGPGMILQAAIDLDLDLAASWMVGDKESDIRAGRTAGVGRLLRYDPAARRLERREDFWIIPHLYDAAALLAAEAE
jgi:D-glycero-D-manno-heptose 1,7-bisphosphate phosphatase